MRYNVEIFEKKSGRTEVIIGKDMSIEDASKRQRTGLGRVNKRYGVRVVKIPVDASADYEITGDD